MKPVLHTIFSFLLLLVVSNSVKAQGTALRPFEGAIHSYQWDGLQEGDQYEFYITADSDGVIVLDDGTTNEFSFIGSNTGVAAAEQSAAAVQINWGSGAAANTYYLWISVNDEGGCSNYRYVEISPVQNNRLIAFNETASNECFDPIGNDFELTIDLVDSNGQQLPENQFPVDVDFTVNGITFQQVIDSATENLKIIEDMFSANIGEDSRISVEITRATDSHNAEIIPDENNLHIRTVFARPVIEFTQR